MTDQKPVDPMAYFRQMVDQWEKMANDYGGKMLGTSEAAQTMQQMTGISLQVQSAVHEGMTKFLAVANMPSRDDFAALAARIGHIEAQLARIEAAAIAPASPDKPKPSRSRQPPAKSQ